MIKILAERHYDVTFGLWHEPSVCCLSVVCRYAITNDAMFNDLGWPL